MKLKDLVSVWCASVLIGFPATAQESGLPDTEPLHLEGDISAQMVAGIDSFLTEETARAATNRGKYWQRDFTSAEAYEKSVEKNREDLRRMIGATDPLVPFRSLEFISDTENPALVAETGHYSVYSIRWPVFEGVYGEGLWVRPKGKSAATIIAMPDCDRTPEMLCGLAMGIDHQAQFARKLAESGCEVFVMQLVNRSDTISGNAELNRFTNQPHREWIYRQAYEMGRHIIGYEVQKVLALVDWLSANGREKIGIAGYGEGGLIAFYSAALDTRLKAAVVSGYFGPREKLWEEPIYRNVFGLLERFGDAEIASLIAPRLLVVEHSDLPDVAGPPPQRQGRSGAAPGKLKTLERYEVEDELNRARELFPAQFPVQFELASGEVGGATHAGSLKSLLLLSDALGFKLDQDATVELPEERRKSFEAQARQERLVSELVYHTQRLLARSERHRDENFWKPISGVNVEDWLNKRQRFKDIFWEEVIGKLPEPVRAMNPRTRLIYDEAKWRGHEVVLDVHTNVFAWGILLVPKDLKEDEKRPVVVCQHGLEGLPQDTIEGEENDGYRYYKAFAAELASRGFITFAPHNPYRGKDQFRVLQRKANPLGKSLFSVIISQHEQILNWLETLPFVDAKRIGFYGLSYGGKTAMRVPSLLERYALSICSADFNEWIKKNVTVDSLYSYMFTGEYEMPEFDLGHTFNYSEMAALIAPRPFMVERGHDDGVAPDEWVAHEYARVRRFYDRLGIGDRTEIEFFNGPHTINGEGTFEFLHKHLDWSAPDSKEVERKE